MENEQGRFHNKCCIFRTSLFEVEGMEEMCGTDEEESDRRASKWGIQQQAYEHKFEALDEVPNDHP